MSKEKRPENLPPIFEDERKTEPVTPVLDEASEAGFIRIKFSRPIHINERKRKLSGLNTELDNQ